MHDLVQMAQRGQRVHYAGAASKIYAEPKRLARLGYLTAEKRPGKTRERTHYALTQQGIDALREWVPLPTPFPRIQNEAVVRLLASEFLDDPSAVVGSLQALRAEIAEQSRILDDSEQRAAAFPHRERQLLLAHSLARRLLGALDEWIDDVGRELRR